MKHHHPKLAAALAAFALLPAAFADMVDPVADLNALPTAKTATATQVPSAFAGQGFGFELRDDRLVIAHEGKPAGEYVFQDARVLRPFLANLRTPDGIPVTRTFPPVAGQDLNDHDTMHPGIWLGFGEIRGEDFWRNKATIRHERFLEPPAVVAGRLSFAAESAMLSSGGLELARLVSRISLSLRAEGFLVIWDATITPGGDGFYFGDQEEMGFGVRLATPLIEKNGGVITNSEGAKTAKKAWGQSAAWCDYSGMIDGRLAGITVIPDPKNFRASWWHARDYGLLLANPFGRKAMKQGEPSRVEVKAGEAFRLRFAALLHSSPADQPPNLREIGGRYSF